jgi:hypothetical protein
MQTANCKLQIANWARCLLPLLAAAAFLGGMSCAKAPGGGGSGIRLVVTMRFDDFVKDDYHYFFLIRNQSDDLGTNGPIPVRDPPYGGNGFATAKSFAVGRDAFTDFVEFNRTGPRVNTVSGYKLYHVPGGTAADSSQSVAFSFRGEPVATVSPNGGNILQFEVDLAQLTPDTADVAPNPDNRPRYLQINFVTTSTLPENSASPDPSFATDAMGDQRGGPSSFNTFLTIDTSQVGKLYRSDRSPGPEERTGDVFGADDPRLDLVFWSVQVVAR